jgi:hypothetical protein
LTCEGDQVIVIRPGTDSALELPRIWMRAELEAFP